MRIGPYEVGATLGQGGMGVVFAARSPDGRDVAIKVLRRKEGEVIARFERERRLLASLGAAEGFVGLLDAGRTADGPYLVMPLVPGGTLRARLQAGPLGIAAAVDLGRSLAAALGEAHARGIVHRDMKPENVLFTAAGRPLVADLGLAKHWDTGAPGASQSVALSMRGTLRGTAGYMAPEQMANAKDVEPSADVYSLGVILYECLAGEPPFTGPSFIELLSRVVDGTFEPLRARRPDVPGWLALVVERALARAPGDRFADGSALEQALAAGGETSAGAAPRRARWLLAALAGLAVAAIAVSTVARSVAPAAVPAPPAPPAPRRAPPDPAPAPDSGPLERDAVAAVASLLTACAEEKPRPARVDVRASEANRMLRALARQSVKRCREACLPLALAAWPLVRERPFALIVGPEPKLREAAIRDAVRGLGEPALAVEAILGLLERDEAGVFGDTSRVKKYEAALEAVAPIHSIAAAELEQRRITASVDLVQAPTSVPGLKAMTELRDALDSVRANLELRLASADAPDAEYIKRTLESVLRSLGKYDEIIAGGGGEQAIPLLGQALAHVESSLALAPMIGPAEYRGLAILHFKRIYACNRRDPPVDSSTDREALGAFVREHRLGVLDEVAEAALLRLGSNEDRARALELAERVCASRTPGSFHIDAAALHALLLMEGGQVEPARKALRELANLRQYVQDAGTTLVFGVSLAELNAIAHEKLPGGK